VFVYTLVVLLYFIQAQQLQVQSNSGGNDQPPCKKEKN